MIFFYTLFSLGKSIEMFLGIRNYRSIGNIDARSGDLDIIKTSHANKTLNIREAWLMSLQKNMLEIIKYLCPYVSWGCKIQGLEMSSMWGYISIYKYLLSQTREIDGQNMLCIRGVCKNVMMKTHYSCSEMKTFLRKIHGGKVYKLYVLFRKKVWLWNLRKKRNYWLRVDIQSKPSNFLGSTYGGILYEEDTTFFQ